MRILIAEDDSALATFVRKRLEAEHYAVNVSQNGEQTRARVMEFDFEDLPLLASRISPSGPVLLNQSLHRLLVDHLHSKFSCLIEL
jgi:CheY-like chemotaxis protein